MKKVFKVTPVYRKMCRQKSYQPINPKKNCLFQVTRPTLIFLPRVPVLTDRRLALPADESANRYFMLNPLPLVVRGIGSDL